MIAWMVVAILNVQSPSPELAWTWTLYDQTASVGLANEVPDTPSLRTTLECEPGSGVARLTLYQAAAMSGMATVSAGEASAVSEVGAARGGGLRLAMRTDHPVFAAFGVDGRLTVSVGNQRRFAEVPQLHLAKLRRFAELCAG